MKRKWLWIPVIVIAVLIAGVVISALMMSPKRDITATATIHQPPQALYATLTDFAAWPSWYTPAKSSTRVADANGHQVWKMELPFGAIQNEVVTMTAPDAAQPGQIDTHVADPAAPVQGGWSWTLTPKGDGTTQVTLVDHGHIQNPFMRLMMWRLVGPSATIIPAVTGLAKKFGETPEVTVTQKEVD